MCPQAGLCSGFSAQANLSSAWMPMKGWHSVTLLALVSKLTRPQIMKRACRLLRDVSSSQRVAIRHLTNASCARPRRASKLQRQLVPKTRPRPVLHGSDADLARWRQSETEASEMDPPIHIQSGRGNRISTGRGNFIQNAKYLFTEHCVNFHLPCLWNTHQLPVQTYGACAAF